MKKGGILTTLFSLVLFLAGALILLVNYLDFPEFLTSFEMVVSDFTIKNLSLTQEGDSTALLIPGAFLVLEAIMIKFFRKKRPYSIAFALFLFFIYFTLVVSSHFSMGLSTPTFIMSRIDPERSGLISILIVLEVLLALVILYITGSMNQKYRQKMESLAESRSDADVPSRSAQNPYMSRRKQKKIEERERKREAKREQKEREKEEKRQAKIQAEQEREQERADKNAKAQMEKEEKKAQKKEDRLKRKEEKKRKKSDEEEEVDESFRGDEIDVDPIIPEKAISMDQPLKFPEFGDIPRLSTIEHSEDLDMVSPDPRTKFKEAMGLESRFSPDMGEPIEVEAEEEDDEDEFTVKTPKYDPSLAGSHFKKGGILEATIESMGKIDPSAPVTRPSAPILGLDDKEEVKEEVKPNKNSIAPSNLSKDHPRYKLFESLRRNPTSQSANVSHIPSKTFETEEKEKIEDNFSPYESTYRREEEQRSKLSERLDAMKRESLSTENPLNAQEEAKIDDGERLRRENEELKARIEMLNKSINEAKATPPAPTPAPAPTPIRAEDIESIDQKNKGKYDDGSDEVEMREQENELYLSVGIAGLASNDEGLTGIKNRARQRYVPPTMDILLDYPTADREIDDYTLSRGDIILSTLHDFKVDVTLDNIVKGPTVTMYELKLAEGVPVSKIKTRYDDLQYALGVRSIRILAPVPGKQAVGIEVPNSKRATIGFKDMLYTFNALPDKDKMAVPMILGRTITGEPVSINVAKAPHLLIAGSTGSGKSVGINSLIATILYNRSPQEVRLIMVDPKVVELKIYNGIPHLLTPVITEAKRVQKVLAWLTDEMDRRYKMISRYNVRNIEAFNEKLKRERLAAEKLPYIVLIMDEYADLMSTIGKDIEFYVGRLAAMARAVGIHIVLATQRPSAEVVTGTIKNNIPSRIAFAVAAGVNSKIILDEMGAESLLGKGDMLYKSPTSIETQRIQGAFLSDGEVEKIVEQVKLNGEADYLDESIFEDHEEKEEDFADDDFDYVDSEEEEYERAKQIVYEKKSASASYLQRRMKIGYNKAARYVERMEEDGIVGPPNGSKPRELIKMV